MDELITELRSVIAVMDTIPVAGIANMQKLTSCADRVRLVADILESAKNPTEEDNANG